MGKDSFQYALTRDQSIALVLVEPLGCTELVKYIIRVIKAEQLNDARREHLCMVCSLHSWAAHHSRIMHPQVFVNIQYLRPGFMRVIVPSEENADWIDVPHSRPCNLELVPGMMDMRLQDKLEMIEDYLAPAWGAADADRVRDALYFFNKALSGSTDEDDYGGVILIAHTPELGVLPVRTAVPEQLIDFIIL